MLLKEIFEVYSHNATVNDSNGEFLGDNFKNGIDPVFDDVKINSISWTRNGINIEINFIPWTVEQYVTITNGLVTFEGDKIRIDNNIDVEVFNNLSDLRYHVHEYQKIEMQHGDITGSESPTELEKIYKVTFER